MTTALALTTIEVGIAGAGDAAVTVTFAEAVEPPKFAFPAQVAVTVSTPQARLAPLTVSVAVATVAVPPNIAVPKTVLPSANVTEPAGTLPPLTAVRVAVNCTLALAAIVPGAAARVIAVPTTGGRLLHLVTRLNASTEPRPVARS
jgi:hypothetical protein